MLASRVEDTTRRLEGMDAGGTRGVAVLAAQVAEVVKDVADLRLELGKHDQIHRDEQRARVNGRRWAVMAVIAALALIESPLIYLVTIHG